jgi:CHASE2 domain-containing sensor protein
MKYLFRRDTLLATASVFLVIYILLYNPLNEYIFNPLKISFEDFALTDLAFSQGHLKTTVDERILIVNIDTGGRKTIAKLIDHIEDYHPKIIGLDILLPQRQVDGNDEIKHSLQKFKNIILSQFAEYNDSTKTYTLTGNQFATSDIHSGFVNFIGLKGDVVRYFPDYLEDGKNHFESFTSEIVKISDSIAYKNLQQRNNRVEWINYQRLDSEYYTVNFNDVLNDKIDTSFVRDKIILIGYISHNANNIEDKHFTPLNNKILGRSIPDMNGVVIHANILSMILDGTYITRVPVWLTLLIAVFITWLHMAFLIRYYIHTHLWFHLAVKTVELIISVLLFYFSVLLLRYMNLDIDFTLTLIAIVIGVDVLYFYDALIAWLTKKFSIKSVFDQMHNRS